ncbi:regulator [Corynebacterium sp. HMSC074A09]|uniref:Regulator n=1 Tax=Corynebacterium minutissimum TaxID=38301 RepID=A0ACC4UAQ7_9CORY|nr:MULTISPECIES: PTS sugar transporter subunit IIC [unclassified Corynebacterium]KKO80085.1 regulator [Corynebacterium minutissimum]OFK65028.1 regulator [Corynebacterium sp. HMSC074A09]OFN35092.1 regulator [Corynebacterium sp. HMSC072A04]OFQ53455.1 regulator [Corynebacterium sp. HMSC074H12]
MSTAQQIDERKLSPIPHASAAPAAERLTPGSFTMKVLNGISIAVVVSLVPQALLGELAKALLPFWSGAATVMALTGLAASLLPVMIGVLIGIEFKMTPIQTAAVGIASFCGSGVATVNPEGGFFLKGTGLVINSGLTAAIAVGLLLFIGDKLKNYSILLLSTIVTLVAGTIGWVVTYPVVKVFTLWLGNLVNGATTLQPVLMGVVLAILFAIMIVSPVSTVGIATAIFIDGVASGTANLGAVAAGFTLLVAGWRVNGFATSILHVLGSPKVQMANMLSKPVTFLPVLCSAAVLGGVGGALGISGTPISAGFGISGLMGPLAALNYEGWGWSAGNVMIITFVYLVLPLALALLFCWLFEKVLHLTKSEYFSLDFT